MKTLSYNHVFTKLLLGLLLTFFAQMSLAQVYFYDEISNPNEVLSSALNEAKESNKNIIMQLGANWCGDAKKLDSFYLENPELEKTINEDFIFIRINVHSDGSFSDFYEKLPYFTWVPTIMILDGDGAFLKVIDGRELESEDLYSTQIFLSSIAPFKK